MRCIICRKKILACENNREHVVPAALGGNFTIQNVCRQCNSFLGASVDVGLTENPIILLHMNIYKIKKNGKYVNPYQKDMIDTKTGTKMRMSINPQTGEFLAPERVSPSIEYEELPNNRKRAILTVSPKMEQAGMKMLRNELKRKYNLNIQDMKSHLVQRQSSKHFPVLEYNETVNVYDFYLGVLKISYELACYWMGENYIECNYARKIANILKTRSFDDINRFFVNITSPEGNLIPTTTDTISVIMGRLPEKGGMFSFITIFNIFSVAIKICDSDVIGKMDLLNDFYIMIFDCRNKSHIETTMLDYLHNMYKNIPTRIL